MSRLGRSLLAVLGGLGVTVLVFLRIGLAVERFTNFGAVPWHSPRFDTPASFVLAAGRLFASIAAGAFVASWPGRGREMRHAAGFGILILLFALVDGAPPASARPLWYTVTELVMLVPAAVAGGLAASSIRGHGRLPGGRLHQTAPRRGHP